MFKQGRAESNESLISPVARGRPRSSSFEYTYPQSSIASSSAGSTFNPFMDISPEAAFIAASAATGIVSSSQAAFFRSLQNDEEITMGSPAIPVSPTALRLINQFLDFLLFTILTKSKGTSLMVLRPAVQEVLRARLATEAMAGADQELESYLGGQIGAELDEPEQPEEDWDLHGTWRRTRLRCMVYSSLGDLEEDDEDEYPEYENPNYDPISATVARVVSPPVAIWLTAILEFIGEQCLHVAGHATITRYSATRGVASSNIDGNGQNAHMPSVEELDAERVALNPSLGRLWRQWRKRTRGPGSISLSARESSSILSRLERQSSVNSMRMSLYGSISNESLRESLSPQPRSISDMPVTKEDEEESAFEAVEPESAPKVLIKDIETRKADEAHAEPNARKVEVETPQSSARPSKKRPLSMSLMATFEEICREYKRPRATSLPPPPKSEFQGHVEAVEYCACEGQVATENDVVDAAIERSAEELQEEEEKKVVNRREFSFVSSSAPIETARENKDPEEAQLEAADKKAKSETDVPAEHGKCAVCGKLKKPVELSEVSVQEPKLEDAQVEDDCELQIGTAITTDEPVISGSSSAQASAEDLTRTEPKDQALKITIPQIAKPVEAPVEYQQNGPVPRTFESDRLGSGSKNSSLPSIVETKEDSESVTDFETANSSPLSPARHGKGSKKAPIDDFLDSDDEEEVIETIVAKTVTVRAVSREVSRERDGDDSSGRSSPKSAVSDGRKGSTSGSRLTPPLTVTTVTPTSPHHKRRSMSVGKNSFDSAKRTAPHAPIAPIAATPQTYGTGAPVRPWTPNTPTEHSRRSSSFSKAQQRPLTAGSNQSGTPSSMKVKTFMTWPDSKPRKSEDASSGSSRDWSNNGRAGIDDKGKSFEELIQSGGTIHCTITPDPIRDFDSDSIAEYPLRKGSVAYSVDMQRPSTTMSTSTHKTTSTSIRIPASAARDARVTDSSTQSLALFLRSTGPPDSAIVTSPKSAVSEHSQHSMNGAAKPKSLTAPSPVDAARAPAAPVEKLKFVPREASGSSTGESTAYLADFFRTTNPPQAEGAGATQRRISKSVAPFRNTLDSTNLEIPPMDKRANERSDIHLSSSPGGLSTHAASYQSSVNSTSGLIKNAQAAPRRDDQQFMPAPQRKQHRVRDPYAIDYDDDDLDLDDDMSLVLPPPPKKPQREEESLIDFLRNNPPPSMPAAPPTPRTPQSPTFTPDSRTLTKKSSSVSLISRLQRTTSRKSSITSPIGAPPSLPDFPSKHIPLITDLERARFQYGNGTQSAYSASINTNPGYSGSIATNNGFATPPMTPQSAGGRRLPVVAEPREAKVRRGEVDSLADFLRNTGPPPEPVRREEPVLKSEKSFSKLRGMSMLRRKKNVAVV